MPCLSHLRRDFRIIFCRDAKHLSKDRLIGICACTTEDLRNKVQSNINQHLLSPTHSPVSTQYTHFPAISLYLKT